MERLANYWLRDVGSRIAFRGNTKITASIDLHAIPYYGDTKPEWVTGMKHKLGTSYSITFLIVTVTTGTIRFPVHIRLVTKTLRKNMAHLIDDVLADLSTWLKIKRVLLDRGFCTDGIIQVVERRCLEWIIAAKNQYDIRAAKEDILDSLKAMATEAKIDTSDWLSLGRWARKQGVAEFVVDTVSTGKGLTPVRLVAVLVRQKTKNRDPNKRWTYCLFMYLTNMSVSPRYLVALYGKRWGVETDIRCLGEFRSITNSTKPQVRILLHGLAVVLDALWVVCSCLANRKREKDALTISEETVFLIKQRYKLICTARQFLRWLRDEIRPIKTFQGGDA